MRQLTAVDEQLARRGYRLYDDTDGLHLLFCADWGDDGSYPVCLGIWHRPIDDIPPFLEAHDWPQMPQVKWRCPTHNPEEH